MNEPKVSVIIPTYNTARFLEKCLSSIASQSYRNIEIIIVNDGSTDNTDEIISHFISKEERAIYITQKNQGVSAARNIALKRATGEYIIFCDSDDYTPENAILNLVQTALKENADIIIGNYINKNRLGERLVKTVKTNTAIELIESFIVGINHAGLWNKLYRKKCLSGLSFNTDISIREDMLFNVQVLLGNPKISFIAESVYFYIQRRGSAVREISTDKIRESNCVSAQLEQILDGKVADNALRKMLALDAYCHIASCLQTTSKEQYESNINKIKNTQWSLRERIVITMLTNKLINISRLYKAARILKRNILTY